MFLLYIHICISGKKRGSKNEQAKRIFNAQDKRDWWLGVRNSWSKIPQKLHQQSFFLRSRAEKFSCDYPVTPRPCFRMVAIDWFSAGRNFDGRMLSIWTPSANAPFQHPNSTRNGGIGLKSQCLESKATGSKLKSANSSRINISPRLQYFLDGSMAVVCSFGAWMVLVWMSFLIVMICEVWLGGDVVTTVRTDKDGFGANL